MSDEGTVCTNCMDGFVLDTATNTCLCEAGFYFERNLGSCEACHPHCKTCSSAARSACSACFPYSTLSSDGYCMCNQGTAETNCDTCISGVCRGEDWDGKCHETCRKCIGAGFADCTSCYPTGVLNDGTCQCSPDNLAGDQCRRCPATCLECNSSGGCSACFDLAKILAPEFGVCVCVNSYPNPTSTHCVACHKTCKKCSGPLSTHCTSCYYPAVLLSDGSCICRGLYYLSSSGQCSSGSYLCSNLSCTQCKNSANLIDTWQSSDQGFYGQCSCYQYYDSSNDKGIYEDYSAGICHTCNSLCASRCLKFTDLCWSCTEHAILSPISPLSSSPGTCSCERGYYATNDGCVKCSSGCLYCNSQSECTQCMPEYEFQTQSRSCVCATAACKCAPGTFLLRQTGLCERLCPSGFVGVDSECKDSAATKFTFTLDRPTKSFRDSTGNFTLVAGDPNTPNSSPSVLYQRGAYFPATGNSFVRLSSTSSQGIRQLVLAPTHYIEMWVKCTYFNIERDIENSVSSGFSRLNYQQGWMSIYLRDVFGKVNIVYVSGRYISTENWSLQRFEIITSPKEAGFATRIRVSANGVMVAEQTVLEYYYRDGPFDFNSTFLRISLNANSVVKSYLAELTIANRLWSSEPSVNCGCSTCTTSGFCLSSCLPNEFPMQNGTCGKCLASCTQGCVRATDCNLSIDPLCASLTTFTSCAVCKSLASLVRGVCTCDLHSTFRPGNNTCTCDPSYQLSSEGICVLCLNYFSPDQVTADISEDFMSVTLTFAEEVQSPSSEYCSTYFMPETFEKFGSGATCTWSESAKKLKVLFGSGAMLKVEEVWLDNHQVLKKNGPCSFSAPKLRPMANYKGLMPIPVPVLSAPSSVALDCSTEGSLQLSSLGTTGGKGRDLKYKWAFEHSSLGILFPQYTNFSDLALVTLPLSTLTAGNLTVVLTIKNEFGKEANVSQVIEMKGGRALLVEFDSGPALNITSQNQGQIKAFIKDTCGMTGDRRYSWSYLRANATLPDTAKDPALLLRASKVPYALRIEKGALTPGYTYTFEVVAEQAGITGSARLAVTVLRSPLVLRLNRVSGSHPSDMTLRLDASLSLDPDQLPGTSTYLWTCSDGAGACLDVNGSALIRDLQQEAYALAPQTLRPSEKYNFTVTVSKDVRTVTGSIFIEIVAPTGCSIVLAPISKTINSHSEYALIPSIDTSLETDFLWRQVTGPAVTAASKPSFAFLSFKANALQAGQSYSFELNARTVKGTIIALFGFTVNRAPIGGKVAIQPTTGVALIDNFLMYSEAWEDPEGNYPLTYQFCISKNNNEPYCLYGGQSKPWQNSKLYKGTLTLIARAFDNLGGRGECSLTINIASSYRLLETFDEAASFRSDIQDPENTYAMAIAYSESLTATDSFFKQMLWAVGNYTATVFSVTPQVLDSYLSSTLALSSQAVARLPDNAIPLLQRLNETVAEYSASLSSSELGKAAAIVAAVAANSTDEVRLEAARIMIGLSQIYNAQRLPDEGPFTAASAEVCILTQRVTAATIAEMNLTLGSLSIAANSGWLKDVPAADILDIYMSAYTASTSFAWIIQMKLQRSGSYSNYNVQFDPPESIMKLSKPVNVSIPCSVLENVEVECIGETENGEWSKDVCEVLEVRSGSVLVSTTVFSALTVQKVPERAPETLVPQANSSSDCEMNPAPLSIAAVILVLSALGVVLQYCPQVIGATNSQKVVPYTPSAMNTMRINSEIQVVEGKETERKVAEYKGDHSQVAGSTKYFSFHLLVRCLARGEDRPRCVCVAASTALVQVLVLGLCYALWDNSNHTTADVSDIFSQYSQKDLQYVVVALGAGTLTSSTLLLCRWPEVASLGLVSASAFGGIAYLNSDLCYSEGGRWGEGSLWTLLLQFLVIETLKALGSFLKGRLRTK